MGYNTKRTFEKKAKTLEGKKAKLEEMRNCEKNHKRGGKKCEEKTASCSNNISLHS